MDNSLVLKLGQGDWEREMRTRPVDVLDPHEQAFACAIVQSDCGPAMTIVEGWMVAGSA
jgi:hypothetical protein